MKPLDLLSVGWMAWGVAGPGALAQPARPEIADIALAPTRLTIRGEVGVTNVIEYAEVLATNRWLVLTNLLVTDSPYVVGDLATRAARRFYRVVVPGVTHAPPNTNAPAGMALIPAGPFTMGDSFNEGYGDDVPWHTVQVSAFYMDKHEVTMGLWAEVYNWATNRPGELRYAFDNPGSYYNGAFRGKGPNHPVHSINWYDMVKWCNARSEQEGRAPAYYTGPGPSRVYRAGRTDVRNEWVKWDRGYRLPTEAEWEKAARGGASGHRFPWVDADTITHSRANYWSTRDYAYDVSPTRGAHPAFNDGVWPYTSPAGYFAPNGYGLHDLAGNVWEWCWDWYGPYSSDSQTDPRGPASGSIRVLRGGSWGYDALICRVAYRVIYWPGYEFNSVGFRAVLPPGQ